MRRRKLILPSILFMPLVPSFSGAGIDETEIYHSMEKLINKNVEIIYLTNPVYDRNKLSSYLSRVSNSSKSKRILSR